MGLAGDEKRIRALFFELKAQDQLVVPAFDRLRSYAHVSRQERASAFSRSLVVVSVCVAISILCALTMWLRNSVDQTPRPHSAVLSTTPNVVSVGIDKPSEVASGPAKRNQTTRSFHRPASHRRAQTGGGAIMLRAVALSQWQSPTAGFLGSPSDSFLKSLPQLDQSARELESFLPRNHVKESSQ